MAAGRKEFGVVAILKARDQATGPMARAFKRVKTELADVRKVGSGMLHVGKWIAGAGLAAAGAAVGVYKFTSDTAKNIDEQSKLSRQLGISIEYLQEMEYVAKRTGAATKEELAQAFGIFSRNLGYARQGTGTLITYLNKAGAGGRALAKQLKGAGSTEEALNIAIAAMERIKKPTDRAAYAMALFGRGGLKMARLTDEGTDGIARLRKEARNYGLVSTAAGLQAESFVDSQEALGTALTGVKNSIASQLMPVIQPYINELRDWAVANREIIAADAGVIVKDLAETIKGVDWASFAKNGVSAIKLIVASLNVALWTVDKLYKILKAPVTITDAITDELTGINKVSGGMADRIKAFSEEAKRKAAERRKRLGLPEPMTPEQFGNEQYNQWMQSQPQMGKGKKARQKYLEEMDRWYQAEPGRTIPTMTDGQRSSITGAAPAQEVGFNGKMTVKVESNMPAKVTSMTSDNPQLTMGYDLDLGRNGLYSGLG